MPPRKSPKRKADVNEYRHEDATSPMRPEVGTQPQFKKKKPPAAYRYDSSLAPELQWDEGNTRAREEGEALIREVLNAPTLEAARAAAARLAALGRPFLNWAGKAERGAFTVPTLPLFIHERLATQAIIVTLKGHRRDKQEDLFDLFADPRHTLREQVLGAYEHADKWVNRMILGDSLVAMNSLLRYESLGGQVQMIYMDPPYGVKFGSNFQPFVRRRDVKDGDDDHLSREPEMVRAYRDTWELGLHSYLSYLRDRLLLCRDLLHPSGSIFVQISDENVHHVREVMDEVFGHDNFCGELAFRKTGGQSSLLTASVHDYLLWYAKDRAVVKYRKVFKSKVEITERPSIYRWVESPDKKTRRKMTKEEFEGSESIDNGWRIFAPDNLASLGKTETGSGEFTFDGVTYKPGHNQHWKTTQDGLNKLAVAGRLIPVSTSLYYIRYLDDFPLIAFDSIWADTSAGGYSDDKSYVVQTNRKVVQRCLLMTTDPGDLVLDPTCGSGTTAYVAEQWGRRWITMDVSRVPLALARQRLLTATFPWYELQSEPRGPASGFVYTRKQNNKGEEVGGIVPHVTLKSIANDLPPEEEVLVDRPEVKGGVTRVAGPFVVEATIPTPIDWEGDGVEDSAPPGASTAGHADYIARMLEALRLSPVLHVGGGKKVTLAKVRPPAKTLSLAAEAVVANGPGGDKVVALVFGPENGAVSEALVANAAKEANAKNYAHLYVIGFAVQAAARQFVEDCEKIAGVAATYIQATPDLVMGDLLKNMRSSQLFSVCGLPDVRVTKLKGKENAGKWQVELRGLDVFDPATMEAHHLAGDDVPAWLLDTDYNGSCFHVCQAFFPRTGAWENLKKALRAEYDEAVWDHLAGAVSAPFEAGETATVAVKVIDDRGNELMVVRDLREGAK